ncbi:MAG: hypothetical protein ACKV2Q_25310 [Planctomycetaceae bacterium]
MKMIVALLMGCLPLALLTVGSFLPAGQDRKTTAPPKVDDSLGASAKQQQAEAGKASEYLLRLEKGDLLSPRELPPDVALLEPFTPAGKKWFGAVYQGWSNAQAAHDVVVGFVALFHPKPISEKQKLLAALEKFAARTTPLGSVPGDERFVEYVTSLCDELGPQIKADEHRGNAQKFFTQRNYSDCLTELQLINPAKLDKQQLEGVKELQRQAEFKQYWKTEPTESDVSLTAIEKRRRFLQSSPSAVLDDEKAKIEQVKQALALAECQQEFKQLREQPPAQARDYLRRAAALVQNKSAPPDVRPSLRTQFLKWVTLKLPVREAGIGTTTVKETKRKNGTLIAGVFEKKSDKPVWYYYWETETIHTKFGLNWPSNTNNQLYLVQDLGGNEPQPPLCLRQVAGFNEGRKKLLAHWESETEWREFVTLCQQLQTDWKEYQKQGGLAAFEKAAELKVRDLEIEAALTLANEVLGEWSSVAVLVGE